MTTGGCLIRVFTILACSLLLYACSAATPLNLLSGFGQQFEVRTISYGEDRRQAVDIYVPDRVDTDTPVVLFFYGGAWDSGDRADYRFVGGALANQGIITAVADYRVYPQVTFPLFVNDAAKAFAAVKRDTGTSGPIFVMGHSAGAQIAALLVLDPRYLEREGYNNCADVAGLIGLAGAYDFLPLPFASLAPIFPEDTRRQSQPVLFAKGKKPPSLLLHGADDKIVESVDTKILADRLRAGGNRVDAIFYENVSHAGILGALSPALTKTASTRSDILAFVAATQQAQYSGCERT
ncbi:MAG: alpha/beta hydrolase [Alphaproteobacteria bacterium]|nr:alpha/beta hydrolase [Alphaproteobacteria bacterium]